MRTWWWRSSKLRWNIWGLLLISSISHGQTPDTYVQTPKTTFTAASDPTASSWVAVVELRINGKSEGEARVLQLEPGKFYATGDSFAQWRLKPPPKAACQVEHVIYFAVADLPNAVVSFDPSQQILSITAPASSFVETRLGPVSHPPFKADSATGVFLNHDFRASYADGHPGLAGLMQGGLFSRAGILTVEFAESDLTKSTKPLWLNSIFEREVPELRASLTLGDAVSASAPWASQVHYTGLRWASKFSTQPDFVSLVLPSMAGTATQASTVDIFVNDMETIHQSVDTGPFSVQNIPVIGDEGDIRMVVTDELGHQLVISRPFIAASTILPPGVNEYTYEAGALRRNFGVISLDYDSFAVVGTQRRGITPELTLDARTEILDTSQTFAGGADYAVASIGILSGGAALSHAATVGDGMLAYGTFARQTKKFSFSANAQVTNSTFRQLGLAEGTLPSALTMQAQLSHNIRKVASFALGYLKEDNRLKSNFSATTISTSLQIGGGIYFAGVIDYTPGIKYPLSSTITLVKPFGNHRTLSASTNIDGDGLSTAVDLIKQVPVSTGYGYRVHTDLSTTALGLTEADVTYQNSTGTYQSQSSEKSGELALSVEETSSLVLLDSHILRSRWIDNSFALVEVPDIAGVKVFANNQFIAETNAKGLVVIPTLIPYQQNMVRLDDDGVPIDINLDLAERAVVPRSNTGVVVKFSALHETGATVVLVGKDQIPLPLGTQVTITGDATQYEVYLHGEVYVRGILFPAHMIASGANGNCEVTVEAPLTKESLPRIGPLVCEGIK
jgi:outer membrane usher protein